MAGESTEVTQARLDERVNALTSKMDDLSTKLDTVLVELARWRGVRDTIVWGLGTMGAIGGAIWGTLTWIFPHPLK